MLKLSLLVTALLMAAIGLHLIGLPQDDLLFKITSSGSFAFRDFWRAFALELSLDQPGPPIKPSSEIVWRPRAR